MLVKFVALTAVLCCSLTTVTAIYWGDWGKVEKCPKSQVAVGFSLKTEREQGSGDDSALNSVSFKCAGGTWIYSTEGPKGIWGKNFMCAEGSWLTSCKLRVESKQGASHDDSSANNLNCKCSDGVTLNGDGLSNGKWLDWKSTCPDGIIGIQTRVEANQGEGDDSALNDVQFTCAVSKD